MSAALEKARAELEQEELARRHNDSVVLAFMTRDSWATPEWLTALLPEVDLDPCSNANSTVRAGTTYDLARGQDGLALPWFGSVYVNGPFSDLLPWADKLHAETMRPGSEFVCAGFLVNADSSTKWWKRICEVLTIRLDFDKRVQFKPPPGIKPSTNSKPQTLLMDETFLRMCDPALLKHGRVWEIRK